LINEITLLYSELLHSYGAGLLIASLLVYFVAGVIKGTLGIGFPTAAVSLLAQFTDAKTAIVVVIMPMLITNLWQVFRSRRFMSVLLQYWRLIVAMSGFIIVFALLASAVPVDYLAIVLGIIVVIFAANSLFGRVFKLPAQWDHPAQWVAGCSAGMMGGLVSVWAPPILIYLGSRRLPKEEFVATIGTVLLLGSSFLLIGFWQSGALSNSLFVVSCLLVPPAIAGFSVGELIRRRLSAQRFERLLLWFFLVMGLNLIRKSLW